MTFAASAVVAGASIVDAAPVTLDGMNQIKSWTDYENVADDTPDNIWGDGDTKLFDEVGIYIEFKDGTTGSITFSGVSDYWNSGAPLAALPGVTITATGFFESYAGDGLWALNNTTSDEATGSTTKLPSITFGDPLNVKPRYFTIDYPDGIGPLPFGWDYAYVTTYGGYGEPNVGDVPLPAAGFLLVGALGGLAALRRRQH